MNEILTKFEAWQQEGVEIVAQVVERHKSGQLTDAQLSNASAIRKLHQTSLFGDDVDAADIIRKVMARPRKARRVVQRVRTDYDGPHKRFNRAFDEMLEAAGQDQLFELKEQLTAKLDIVESRCTQKGMF